MLKPIPPMPTAETAIAGRDEEMSVSNRHLVLGVPLKEPYSSSVEVETIYFGMGCFWGAERKFWRADKVYTTAVGYAGGFTRNPTYEEVCSGYTGHTEVVKVVYEGGPEALVSLLRVFWEAHDPTQGMRQGNDRGTQYRSCIYVTSRSQLNAVEASRDVFQVRLAAANFAQITTEIKLDQIFYYAEDYHQQYLEKNPQGYCGLQGTGVVL